jgi:hypothetical protein
MNSITEYEEQDGNSCKHTQAHTHTHTHKYSKCDLVCCEMLSYVLLFLDVEKVAKHFFKSPHRNILLLCTEIQCKFNEYVKLVREQSTFFHRHNPNESQCLYHRHFASWIDYGWKLCKVVMITNSNNCVGGLLAKLTPSVNAVYFMAVAKCVCKWGSGGGGQISIQLPSEL